MLQDNTQYWVFAIALDKAWENGEIVVNIDEYWESDRGAVADIKDKISEELLSALESLDDDEQVPVYVWTEDIDYELVKIMVEENTGYTKESFSTDGKYESDEERMVVSYEIDIYISAWRNAAKRLYNEKHRYFESNCLSRFENIKQVFKSQYAPMMICELSKRDVYMLAYDDQVTAISLFVEMEAVSEGQLNISLPAIKADITDGFHESVSAAQNHISNHTQR